MPIQTLPPTRTWSSVLFDLDGTIIDSASDITTSLAHMFSTLGLPVPSEEDLLAFVGPPLLDSLRMTSDFTEEEAWRALEIYRAHAEQFRERFGGEFINPKSRPKWPGSNRC